MLEPPRFLGRAQHPGPGTEALTSPETNPKDEGGQALVLGARELTHACRGSVGGVGLGTTGMPRCLSVWGLWVPGCCTGLGAVQHLCQGDCKLVESVFCIAASRGRPRPSLAVRTTQRAGQAERSAGSRTWGLAPPSCTLPSWPQPCRPVSCADGVS